MTMTNVDEQDGVWEQLIPYFALAFDVLRMVFQCVCILCFSVFRAVVPEPRKSVRNRIVLVTGSGNGLGRHLALKFAKLGASVVLWDVDKDANEKVCEEIRNRGGDAWAFVVDVSDEKEVEEMGRKVSLEVGDVDILVNNAGVLPGKPIMQLNSYQIRRTMEINTFAHFWTIRHFLPRMLERGSGHIVTVASIAGMIGCANLTDYCASKHATIGFMSALREDLYNQGKEDIIQITVACPPTMLTRLVQKPITRFPALYPLYKPERIAHMIVDGTLRNRKLVMPSTFFATWKLGTLFPQEIITTVQRFCDYTIAPNAE